jgi:hypothetical protein
MVSLNYLFERGLSKIVFWATFLIVLAVLGGGAYAIDALGIIPGFFAESFTCICIGSVIIAAVISGIVMGLLRKLRPTQFIQNQMGGGGFL